MPSFAIRYPFFVLMACLMVVVVGIAAMTAMPVDLFPPVKIPVVVVATFFSGMPPQQIESDITDSDERFFTLGSNIDHIESRSMSGVSLIKIYFQPGSNGRREQHLQPRDGEPTQVAPRNASACRAQL
jgi:multidrug efflux pump subunit AcrB